MKITPTPELVEKFSKTLCKHYGTKIIYTDNWIGRLYKKIVAVPVINKAMKKANAGDPSEWLEDRVFTAGKYIVLNEKVGSGINQRELYEEIKTLIHENVHKIQQDREGVLDFYIKYFEDQSLQGAFELEAIKTEMYMNIWNDLPIGTVNYHLNSLKNIYGFNKKTLAILKQAIQIILNEYNKYGSEVLSSEITDYATELLLKYNK
jgi:hypothetical protein